MSILYVFYKNSIVGILTNNDDATLSFVYDSNWILSNESFSLSPVLDLKRTEPFNNKECLSYFENLIPEGLVKERLEKLLGKSVETGYKFLEEYGVDCAGAFIISPNKTLSIKVEKDNYKQLDLKELSKAYKNNENLMAHVIKYHNGRFSLAGAQDKIPVVYNEGSIYIPINGAPTTHILKPPHMNKTVKDSVYNEYFCMKLAQSCGLNVSEVDIISGEIPFYLIERYDREIISEDEVARLHQVDFCQVQNCLVSEKYESNSGPNLKDNYNAIQTYSSNVIEDVKEYMNWICFNLLIGNNDSHSKNISFLYVNGKMILSPFYDILCTSIYKEYISNFAYEMNKNNHWFEWNNDHFKAELCGWGLDKNSDILIESFIKMSSKLEEVLDDEVINFKSRFPDIKAAGRIKAEINKRIKSFSKRITKE
ncbi:MAG: type II toxin-antitoxin system HipA family toxin [Spirochaetaceae bacterium]